MVRASQKKQLVIRMLDPEILDEGESLNTCTNTMFEFGAAAVYEITVCHP